MRRPIAEARHLSIVQEVSVDNQPFRDVREYGKFRELVPVSAGTFLDKT